VSSFEVFAKVGSAPKLKPERADDENLGSGNQSGGASGTNNESGKLGGASGVEDDEEESEWWNVNMVEKTVVMEKIIPPTVKSKGVGGKNLKETVAAWRHISDSFHAITRVADRHFAESGNQIFIYWCYTSDSAPDAVRAAYELGCRHEKLYHNLVINQYTNQYGN
jgi:hypothetical protein